ncbi:MAG: PQQ-binding-like beta-propeller repeat protein [Rubrivivax sp.]|nr:PQQ-binding-like beta-propeller repeat protein [Rubrivivax sp.]
MKNVIALAATLAAALSFGASSALAGPTVYIPLGTANLVIAVDAASSRITATYSGVDNAHGLVATPDGEYLVAGSLLETPLPAGSPPTAPNSKLFVVHPGHGHVMRTIPVAGWTHHQAITPNGRYVVSTHPTRGGVSVVDMQSNQVVKTIETGPAPNYTAITRDGGRAYVSNSGNGSLSEIDIATWRVTRTLDGGPGPEHIVLSTDEQTLYSLNPQAGTVSAVSVQSGKVVKSHKIGAKLHGLDLGDDGQTLFISSVGDNKLVALDLRDGSQRSLALSLAPYHLNTIRGTGKVYVSSRSDPVIWVVDQKSLMLTGTIKLPAGVGHQMAVMP